MSRNYGFYPRRPTSQLRRRRVDGDLCATLARPALTP